MCFLSNVYKGDQIMKEDENRLILGTAVFLTGRFSIEVKKSNKSEFGYTVDPKIFIISGNDERKMKYLTGILRYFRMGWSPQKRWHVIVVTRYSDLMTLMEELFKIPSKTFTPAFNKTLRQFYEVLEMYAEKQHYEKEGFFKILDLRQEFMPNAIPRKEWIEKNFGEIKNE